MLPENIKLAIIIPYYKDRYIKETLQSIAQQTNKQFNLYIGDDNSPNAIQEAIDSFDISFRNQIIYHRFTDNLGSKSLTQQWERCIELSTDEPYVWLFSDDDIMPSDAVERFYNFISNKETIDLLRFDIQMVNDDSEIIRACEPHPPFETAKDFLYRRLNGLCISTACEYIFSRRVYIAKKGFVEFPLAWCSDDASWANFAEEKGIFTIAGSPVSWRMGGFNISSDQSATYKRKIQAAILYLKFIGKRYVFTNELKMNMLYGQLSLLQSNSEVRRYFYKEIFKSKIFRYSFLFKHISLRNYNRIRKKVNKGLHSIKGKD